MERRIQDIRKSTEHDLDELAALRAKAMGEDRATAYTKVCETPLGASMRRMIDDATAMLTGQPCSRTLEDMAKAEVSRKKKRPPDNFSEEEKVRWQEAQKA